MGKIFWTGLVDFYFFLAPSIRLFFFLFARIFHEISGQASQAANRQVIPWSGILAPWRKNAISSPE